MTNKTIANQNAEIRYMPSLSLSLSHSASPVCLTPDKLKELGWIDTPCSEATPKKRL